MRTRIITAALTATALITLTACAEGTTEDKPERPAAQAGAAAAEAPADAELPDFTGQTLQAAQDGAQAAGFYGLTSSDASGAGRMQLLDRKWTVCAQTPKAGTHPTDTTVDFSTVKLEEVCP
jgi:hypothetical protein